MSSDLIAAIRMNRRAHHDTLYCNKDCKKRLLNTIDGRSRSSFQTTDAVTVEGLQVETYEAFTVPVTCKKGDIFPLTKDKKEKE